MPKTHLATNGVSACLRGTRTTTNVRQVDCRICQGTQVFMDLKAFDDAQREAAFEAQTPRKVAEPWKEGGMVCSGCGWTFFREADRSCYGHYANYVCAQCGHVESRLTETGMSF